MLFGEHSYWISYETVENAKLGLLHLCLDRFNGNSRIG